MKSLKAYIERMINNELYILLFALICFGIALCFNNKAAVTGVPQTPPKILSVTQLEYDELTLDKDTTYIIRTED